MKSKIIIFLLCFTTICNAAYTVKDGKLVRVDTLLTLPIQEHYSALLESYEKQMWDDLIKHANIVLENAPDSPFGDEALFYLGAALFKQKEYEDANKKLSSYLKRQATPKHFEEAIAYKYSIAEKFRKGAKKHFLGFKIMPKWIPGDDESLAIYEEVIAALPHHDLAAKSLFGKASLLFEMKEYKASIETFQTLMRRFPKHKLSPESYVSIGEVYLTQSKKEYPDPDFLDLAKINLRKFKHDFPGDERVAVAETMFLEMQEIYASTLFETASFFERTKKPKASAIYYRKIIATYPATKVAMRAQEKLEALKGRLEKEKK